MLDLLRAVGDEPRLTQRTLVQRLGIAPGLTKAVLRRASAKGWIDVRSVPTRRYAYYLTPQRFAEKSRLMLRCLERSLVAIREARQAYAMELVACTRRGWVRVAVLGGGEMADIALLGAQEAGLPSVAVIAPDQADQTCSGVQVVADAMALLSSADTAGLDALILTEALDKAARAREARRASLAFERLIAPPFLRPAKAASHVSPALGFVESGSEGLDA